MTKFNRWKVRDKIFVFPSTFTKKVVMNHVNYTFIHICIICGKMDIRADHYSKHIKESTFS